MMNQLTFRIIVFLGMSVLFNGCSHEPIVPRTTFVTAFEQNKTVMIQAGGEIHLELESETQDQFNWSIVGKLPEYVKQIGKTSYRQYTNAMGSANMTMVDLKVSEVGEYTINFVYKNDATGEVKRTYTLNIDARPAVDVFIK